MPHQKKDVLVHQVYQSLKDMILKGELKPGEKIYQERIAEKLGVSRTPLVKAFQILEQEFLTQSIPRRGMYVKSVDMTALLDAYECRQGIETTAVRILAERITAKQLKELYDFFNPFLNSKKIKNDIYLKADTDFHQRLVQLTGNKYLIRMNQISHVFHQTYKLGLIREPGETLSEHLRILSAIETGDAGLAEEYMRNHIRKSIDILRRKLLQTEPLTSLETS